ncbi:MAG TPA: KH domain-containing protein [Acidimicrobiales bacterium]|nr:KH domain-containing protein [Acidimicrobiales bacterium]
MTDLYEAGDINQTGSGDAEDVDDVDDLDDQDDLDDLDDQDDLDEQEEGVGEGNEIAAVDGGTPLAVLTYLAKSLSNDPEAVVIETDERRGGLRMSLHVAPDDMGRVIGRRGRTAQAIRTLVNVAGAKDGIQANVDIVDD